MPVIIERADWPVWLGEADGDSSTASAGIRRKSAVLAGRKEVGNVRNDGPELIEPVVPAEASLL